MKDGVLIWWICLITKLSNNKLFRYLFTKFDTLSKYIWCVTLKNKNGQRIKDEFWNILTTSKRKPNKLERDRALENNSSIFQNFLKMNAKHHFSRFTDKKFTD